MDLKQIQELVKLVNKSGLSELTVKEGEFAITIKTNNGQNVAVPVQQYAPATPVVVAPQIQAEQKNEMATPVVKNENTFTFKSPMIGTFYRKPGADKDPFVKVGDTIKTGDVLCIIEAMKLFNEIEFDGTEAKVVKILIDDASPVEYDQPLFLLEKI